MMGEEQQGRQGEQGQRGLQGTRGQKGDTGDAARENGRLATIEVKLDGILHWLEYDMPLHTSKIVMEFIEKHERKLHREVGEGPRMLQAKTAGLIVSAIMLAEAVAAYLILRLNGGN